MSTRNSDDGVPRVDIGTQNVTRHAAEALKNENALRGHAAGLAPLRNSALVDTQLARNGALTTGGFHRFLHKIFPHDPKYITEIDIQFNAKSDSDRCHALRMNPPQAKSTFWDRLLEAAKANGITPTQEAIATALGVRQSAVAKWKAGGRPKQTRLEMIAKKWRFNLNWLQTEEGPKRPLGVGEVDEVAEALSILKSLNTSNRRVLLQMARELRKGQISASREKEPA
jgi:transcriptional regulator with XRE-family HTH domain